MRHIKTIIIIAAMGILVSCTKFLDVVPDNIATIENAFTLRTSAEKYLFTCYSYMPDNGYMDTNTGFNAADEVWYPDPTHDIDQTYLNIAKGQQNAANPLGNWWSGKNQGHALFDALRDCNIFLDNIGKVTDLQPYDRDRWTAEVTFLKAYYHFLLLQRYGPIPLIKTNLPISATPAEVKVYREPVDSVVNYIVQLLDKAYTSENLPDRIVGNEGQELGRITKSIVLAFKAKVLVTAASPLFNGNPDYANFVDRRGVHLFNPVYSADKWQRAADACKEAIDFCSTYGAYSLSYFAGNTGYILNDTIRKQLDIRTSTTNKINNPEVIWANTNSMANTIQRYAMVKLNSAAVSTSGPKQIIGPTLKMAEMFYTKNGVPINEDKTWDYINRYALKVSTKPYQYFIKTGETTAQLHFDREPRFYADLGFDRGVWFGNWINNYSTANPTSLYYIMTRKGEFAAMQDVSNYCITGYYAKKLVNIETSCASDGNITSYTVTYPWPEMRMADLYLMYSEALNELNGPSDEAYKWIDLVRARAGIPSVEFAWTNFATDPTKYKTQSGFRDIIHHERAIEFMFEGQRYWDLKRWKTAHIELNNPIKGWDITQASAQGFYSPVLLFNQTFAMRDYFCPIETLELQINNNLVQNPGW
ncbi:MAG: RagB/SusD family nutrient uptake outer membrane protein [Bacteroidota bacterium]|nr:RagB/SusD family nutrient uptake outer membrane protein [Bacteroidota bacterium]